MIAFMIVIDLRVCSVLVVVMPCRIQSQDTESGYRVRIQSQDTAMCRQYPGHVRCSHSDAGLREGFNCIEVQ